jgi:hypothetical protein
MDAMNRIQDRMKQLAMNIDEFCIGQQVAHIADERKAMVVDKTRNSICVAMNRRTVHTQDCEKGCKVEHGINCMNWYEMKEFNQLFKI